MEAINKLSSYTFLAEPPILKGGFLISKVQASPKDVFCLFEEHFIEYNNFFKDYSFVDSKTNWEFFIKLKAGIVRIYEYKNTISIGSTDIKTSEELKAEVDILRIDIEYAVLEFIRNYRDRIDNDIIDNPFGNFMLTFEPVLILIERAKENNFLLEQLILSVSLIDAMLRNSLILKSQIDNENDEIDELYIFQKEEKKYYGEKKILVDAKMRVLDNYSNSLSLKIDEFYKKRNKAVHRYFISNFQYSDLDNILRAGESIISELSSILYKLEMEQIDKGVGMTRLAKDREDLGISNPLLRIDSDFYRLSEINLPKRENILENYKINSFDADENNN